MLITPLAAGILFYCLVQGSRGDCASLGTNGPVDPSSGLMRTPDRRCEEGARKIDSHHKELNRPGETQEMRPATTRQVRQAREDREARSGSYVGITTENILYKARMFSINGNHSVVGKIDICHHHVLFDDGRGPVYNCFVLDCFYYFCCFVFDFGL